jgi:ATP-binding cassette, subfamily B, multidrug efflux pump
LKHLKSLNKYFVKYKWRLIGGILFVILSNIPAVLLPQVIRYVIDMVDENVIYYKILSGTIFQQPFLHFLINAIAVCGAIMLVLALLRGFFMFCMRQTLVVMSRHIEYDLKNEIYTHYQLLDLNFFKSHNTGDLMSRITEDVSRVRMYVGPALMYTVNLFVTIAMTIYVMLQVNVELTLYTLAPLPLLAGTIYFVNRIIHRKSEKIQAQLSTLTTLAQENYSGIRVIKSYVQEESTARHFKAASEEYKNSSVNLAKTEAIYFPSMSLIVGLSTLITILIGGMEAIRGVVTVGSIAEFVVYVNMLTFPVAAIGSVASMVQRASASQKRINEFLDTQPAIISPANGNTSILKGDILIHNLWFTYLNTGRVALKNFNLHVKPGQKIAVIGRIGAGKSTLSQLLIRMYDPQQGEIKLDGIPVQQMDLNSLRSQISYVPQDVFLFSDTVANNIRYGVPDAEMEAIEKAARAASVDKEILSFPEKYATMVGERGVTLSGGQKQRISIARALLKNPNILIFDDCLSAVDAKTEKEIIGNLYEFLKEKTAIIITHRIFTLFDFDKIIVLDEGAIVEEGTHDDLLSRNGYYAELYARQQNRETEEAEALNS